MEAVKKDFHKAFKIFETNCLTNGNGHSCHKAGAFKFQGKGCSRDEVNSEGLIGQQNRCSLL